MYQSRLPQAQTQGVQLVDWRYYETECGALCVKLALPVLVLMWSVVNWDITELRHLEVLENWGK